jgi:hypothetical protein
MGHTPWAVSDLGLLWGNGGEFKGRQVSYVRLERFLKISEKSRQVFVQNVIAKSCRCTITTGIDRFHNSADQLKIKPEYLSSSTTDTNQGHCGFHLDVIDHIAYGPIDRSIGSIG